MKNLFRALQNHRDEAQEKSNATLKVASLRGELSVVTEDRDKAVAEAMEFKSKAIQFQEELRQLKAKHARVQQQKTKLERDQRTAMSFAKSLDSSTSTDVDYYKRKMEELSSQLQGKNAVINEKTRQVEDLRRQLERNMSQNRLANLRRDDDPSVKRNV